MTPLAPHIAAFLRERLPHERRASLHTCETYAHAFRLLFEYAATRLKVTPSQLHLEHIDAPLVLAFLKDLESTRGNQPATRNARLTAIKSFMHFLEYRVPSALDQVRQILAIPLKNLDADAGEWIEAHVLDPESHEFRHAQAAGDADMQHRAITDAHPRARIWRIKDGLHLRHLSVPEQTGTVLREWLAVRGSAPDPALFLNARSQAMTRAGFAYVLRKHVHAARGACPSLRDKRISPHFLRHTCALMTLQATGDIRKVALWLGHNSLQSTEMYLRADPTQKLEAVNLATPASSQRAVHRPRPTHRPLED